MSYKFKCIIDNNKLIIEPRPNGITTISKIRDLIKNKPMINEIVLSEGIELIGPNYFEGLNNIVKITLPSTLKKIGKDGFSYCRNLKEINFPNNPNGNLEIDSEAFSNCESLKNITIKTGVKSIKERAFANCESLESVYLPDGILSMEDNIFSHCNKLKSVRLPADLEKIEFAMFYFCQNLTDIVFPENLKEISSYAFKNCSALKNLVLPKGLIKISNNAFESCKELENVDFNEDIKTIDNEAFAYCKNLKSLILPQSLTHIGDSAFTGCSNLKKVVMNNGVINMGESTFGYCHTLEDITLSNSLKEIPTKAFYDCFNLKKIIIPDNVESLKEDIFFRCHEIQEIILSKNIKKISENSFSHCDGLEKIIIPEGIKEIEVNAFINCFNLEKIYLPTSLEKLDIFAFEYCKKLSSIYLNSKGKILKINVDSSTTRYVENEDNYLFLHYFIDDRYGFYANGEYIEFHKKDLLNNEKIAKLIHDGYHEYIKLYHYSKKRYIPSKVVIESMPTKDIDNFYINKNGQEWSKLIKDSNITVYENKVSFFKLCYVLGVFSESTTTRDKAIRFLNEHIIGKLDEYQIHSKFDGFELSNGFNAEYAEFFMKYYNTENFMICIEEDEWGDEEEVELISASYNNFKNVKKIYPNRTLHTNRYADLLLPEHVMNAVRTIEYYDVDSENELFALEIGKYGYTQKQFETLQEWYNKGKKIEEMKLFVEKDSAKNGITYTLLNKDDPLNAVLGNITNCCQVLAGMGQSCVEYGMTMPNSGFITFNYKGKIVGQAWVWYDESTKTICLDNIEIPHKYLEKINQNYEIQNSFIECLLRLEKSFKKEMMEKGLEVEYVTIGKGYNDIRELLDKHFISIKYPNKLSNYTGYSDAYSQYEIKELKKEKLKKGKIR